MKPARQIFPILVALFMFTTISGAEGQYKKYEPDKKEDRILAKLELGERQWTITFYDEVGKGHESTYLISQVNRSEGAITLGDEVTMNDDGIKGPGFSIDFKDIDEIRIDADPDRYDAAFYFMAADSERKRPRFRQKRDLIFFLNSITVEEDEFVRGSVVSLFGDIDVYGEVNRDVVTVFGDIHAGKEAVIRGDVVSVNGSVKLASGSSVYGAVRSSKGEYSTRRHRARRWKKLENEICIAGDLYYNRVDGLALLAGFKYDDPDSILPSFETLGGYAFSSDRWRYKLVLAQTVLRGPMPVQIGGKVYRLLKSDDDRIIGDWENTIFALLVNEDWKDFYEAEGGYGFVRLGFLRWNRLEVGYLSETQNWLDAHPQLWSLFGAKQFRGNFSSVPYDTLAVMRSDFDDKLIASLNAKFTFDSRDDEKHPRRGWYGYAAYEYSPDKWKGDFDFERFEVILKRYQPIQRYLSIRLMAAYGRAKGNNVPLNRQFFLGGLGTLHGYRHKEFRGNEYMLVSGEYGFRIPRSDISPFLRYDGGKIAPNRLSGENSWCGAISIGICFEENLKLFISRRLDREDEDPIFYARFSAPI